MHMRSKRQRHERIARLIEEGAIASQQDLQERLGRAGFAVTQATLSRDLQQMGVLKGPSGYVLPRQGMEPARQPNPVVLRRTLERELRSIDAAGNFVIIRTDAGHANALAVELDRARLPDILGTIAGDDTIFVAARNDVAAARLVKRIRTLTAAA